MKSENLIFQLKISGKIENQQKSLSIFDSNKYTVPVLDFVTKCNVG